MPFVSSDRDAWMRPYYEAASGEGFALLPIPIQFATLVDAIAQDHPLKAAKLREIDDPAWRRAILGSLAELPITRLSAPSPAAHARRPCSCGSGTP